MNPRQADEHAVNPHPSTTGAGALAATFGARLGSGVGKQCGRQDETNMWAPRLITWGCWKSTACRRSPRCPVRGTTMQQTGWCAKLST